MKKAIALALAVLTTSVIAASAQGSQTVAAKATAGYSCSKTISIPFITPITGGAGFLGAEQMSWATYAAKTLAPALGLKVKIVGEDTPVEQGATPANAVAQKIIGDASALAALGPATSGDVTATAKVFYAAHLAHISPSATRTDFTQGPKAQREEYPTFFRDVPGDYIQGPTDANYMIKTLHVKKVVIMDFQEPYSLGLASAVDGVLKKAGVSTIRLSAPNTTTDYSAYVTKVPSDADIVFFPTQKPGDAQTFAQQLIEQGKKAKVFGSDGSNDSTQFKQPGSYVSNFAPDITGIASDAKIIAGWKKDNPGKSVGSFGPPSYGATQILLHAIKLACNQGHGTATRQSVLRNVKKVSIKNWILGGSFKWSTKSNDPLNAKFYIFQIQSNGSYKLVG
ncbi:MAG TPA: branched-chain amino acid ABC transporter substrate-binding protein [Gaiellaceae bacterium]|jgi:branched-chain amino acid transport system substrate-binding protein|nr:branched-chain amino acid ABC transporter substrate-binding protein [Gaiellaceae bacterium]